MKKKTEKELAVAAALKTARTALRLKYALMADAEINDKLPDLANAVERNYALGLPWEVDVAELFSLSPEALT